MIVYGCMTGTLQKEDIKYISIKQANQILNKNSIVIKSLPGYGNVGLKKKKLNHLLKKKNLSRFDNYSFKLTMILLKLKDWNGLNVTK